MDAECGGQNTSRNLPIHYLAEQTVAQREDDGMKGIYSDVFTAEVRASDDFGIVTV